MVRRKTILALVLLLVIAVWLVWKAVTWLAQNDNGFILYCAVVLSTMFAAGLRDDARRWR